MAKKSGSVMVVGAGIAGMQAALDLANSDYNVYLVEQGPTIGGLMARLDKTFPTNDCAMCTISPKLVETGAHPNIEILTMAEVVDITGTAGNFDVQVYREPRYIDENKITCWIKIIFTRFINYSDIIISVCRLIW